MYSSPSVVDAYGEFSIDRFGTVPVIGDVLTGLSDLGIFGSVRVLSRHFFRHDDRLLSWWMLLVEEIQEQQAILDIDRDVRQAYIEIRDEERRRSWDELAAREKTLKRRQQKRKPTPPF